MTGYLIAADRTDLKRNEGIEIMASSVDDAVARYGVLGGYVGHDSNEGYPASVWVMRPDGSLLEVEVYSPDNSCCYPEDDQETECPECGEEQTPKRFCPECGYRWIPA